MGDDFDEEAAERQGLSSDAGREDGEVEGEDQGAEAEKDEEHGEIAPLKGGAGVGAAAAPSSSVSGASGTKRRSALKTKRSVDDIMKSMKFEMGSGGSVNMSMANMSARGIGGVGGVMGGMKMSGIGPAGVGSGLYDPLSKSGIGIGIGASLDSLTAEVASGKGGGGATLGVGGGGATTDDSDLAAEMERALNMKPKSKSSFVPSQPRPPSSSPGAGSSNASASSLGGSVAAGLFGGAGFMSSVSSYRAAGAAAAAAAAAGDGARARAASSDYPPPPPLVSNAEGTEYHARGGEGEDGVGAGKASQRRRRGTGGGGGSGGGLLGRLDCIPERAYGCVRRWNHMDGWRKRRILFNSFMVALTAVAVTGMVMVAKPRQDANVVNIIGTGGTDGGGSGKARESAAAGEEGLTANGTASAEPGPIDVVCSEENIASFSGYMLCEKQCAAMDCCFLPHWDELSCANAGTGTNGCKPFIDACAALAKVEKPAAPDGDGNDNDGGVEVGTRHPSKDGDDADLVDAACRSTSVLTAEGLEACIGLCQSRMCCFLPTSDPMRCNGSEMEDECYDYEACQILLDKGYSGVGVEEEGGGGGEAEAGTLTSAPAATYDVVAKACEADDVAANGRDKCELYCRDYMCCFHPANHGGCRSEIGEVACDVHAPCEILMELDKPAEGSVGVSSASAEEGSGWVGMGDGTGKGSEKVVNAVIAAACTPEGVVASNLCETMCKEFMCCFHPANHGGCRAELGDECDVQAPCEILMELDKLSEGGVGVAEEGSGLVGVGNGTGEGSEKVVNAVVAAACTPEGVVESNLCKTMCEEFLCCFHPANHGGCRAELGDECDMQAPCEILMELDTIGDGPNGGVSASAAKRGPDWVEDGKVTVGTSEEAVSGIVAEACTRENIARSSVCEVMCEEFMCCFLPAEDGGCAKLLGDVCIIQAPCKILLDMQKAGPVVPPAATGSGDDAAPGGGETSSEHVSELFAVLSEACTENIVNSGSKVCHKLCKDYGCCFKEAEDGGCASTKPDECIAHAPCELLDQLGQLGSGGEGDSDGANSQQQVEEYAILSVACTKNMLDLGSHICEKMCEEHMCCFVDGEDNCAMTYARECAAHAPCEILSSYQSTDQGDGGEQGLEVKATADHNETFTLIAEACNVENLRAGPPSDEICRSLCDGYLCCFADDPGENCYLATPDDCVSHSPCDVLKPKPRPASTGVIGGTPDEDFERSFEEYEFLIDACKEEIIMGGSTICQGMCNDFMCCFAEPSSADYCALEMPEECAAHQPCELLIDLGLVKADGSVDPGVAVDKVAVKGHSELYSVLSEACTDDFESSSTDVCGSLCQDFLCCFEGEDGGRTDSCSASADECVSYGPCKVLVESNEDEFLERAEDYSLVSVACREDIVKSGAKICQEMCFDHLCCFAGSGQESCAKENPEECAAFSPCKVLVDQDKGGLGKDHDQAELFSVLTEACSVDIISAGSKICHKLCNDFMCCFPGGGNGDCSVTHVDDCVAHKPCEVLLSIAEVEGAGSEAPETGLAGDSSEEQNEEDFSILAIACREDMINSGSKICQEMCLGYDCCFEGGCPESIQPDCEAHRPCEILRNGGSGQAAILFDASLCAPKHIAIPGGYVECESQCRDFMCCFDDGNESCPSSSVQLCTKRNECEALTFAGAMFVDDACTRESIATSDGRMYCSAICSQAMCCSDSTRGDEPNCFDDKQEFCNKFKACDVLS